jgi:hypothetical protein
MKYFDNGVEIQSSMEAWMPILAAIPYLGVQALSGVIGLWTNKLARYLIIAALLLGAGFGVKVWLQWGLISEAQITAETTRATEQARADRSEIEKQRDASEEADKRALEQRIAELEEARRASQKPNDPDPVVIRADDEWLRRKEAAGRR